MQEPVRPQNMSEVELVDFIEQASEALQPLPYEHGRFVQDMDASSAAFYRMSKFAGKNLIRRSQADYEATHDELTGMLNEKGFNQVLDSAIDSGRPFGLIALDATNFKRINDRYGHEHGNEVLEEVGVVLGTSLRAHDEISYSGRYGGDEFFAVVMLDDFRTEKGQSLLPYQRLVATVSHLQAAYQEMVDTTKELKEANFAMAVGAAPYKIGMSKRALKDAAEAGMRKNKNQQHITNGKDR